MTHLFPLPLPTVRQEFGKPVKKFHAGKEEQWQLIRDKMDGKPTQLKLRGGAKHDAAAAAAAGSGSGSGGAALEAPAGEAASS